MNVVELFCGSATIAQEFREAGHNTFTVDIRRRKGVCEPDLKKNILQLERKDIPFKKIDVLWLSPPCDVWSYAAGNKHWDDEECVATKKCLEHISILHKCLALIYELHAGYFFLENPRGRLRYNGSMCNFLKLYPAHTKSLTLSSYGFPTTKPTNIFTNAKNYIPLPMDKYGRGAKNKGLAHFNNMTKCQRQKTPMALAREIRLFCEANHGRRNN